MISSNLTLFATVPGYLQAGRLIGGNLSLNQENKRLWLLANKHRYKLKCSVA